MNSTSRPILAPLLMLALATAPATAQRPELPTAVAMNGAELRMLIAESISGGLATGADPAMLAGADMEIWINSQGRPDSLRYAEKLVEHSWFAAGIEKGGWRHGVFPPGAPGWYRWRLAFEFAQLTPKGEETSTCPTQKAMTAVLELVLRSKAQGVPPDSGVQVELRPSILRSPHCDGILAQTVASMRTQSSDGRAEICLEADCTERPSRRVSFRINLTELKWFTTSWTLSTSDGIWYVDCPHPQVENHPQFGRCDAGRFRAIW